MLHRIDTNVKARSVRTIMNGGVARLHAGFAREPRRWRESRFGILQFLLDAFIDSLVQRFRRREECGIRTSRKRAQRNRKLHRPLEPRLVAVPIGNRAGYTMLEPLVQRLGRFGRACGYVGRGRMRTALVLFGVADTPEDLNFRKALEGSDVFHLIDLRLSHQVRHYLDVVAGIFDEVTLILEDDNTVFLHETADPPHFGSGGCERLI
mmetsp:Transcript_13298/g.28215  ORF Transcript_13298/g.28215 Transcript_13298/m.28215 type:complete len:208 (-) Transcript_13298:173-796(-)